MIVRAFYNGIAFPHVLMVKISEDAFHHYENHGDVIVLKNKQNEIIGYNILHYQATFEKDGYQKMSEALLDEMNQALRKAGLSTITHDFTPYIVVGYVETCEAHPDSDHLHICQVNIGESTKQIVCGAANVAQGQKVVVALENAVMPNGQLIKNGKLRGVESFGMLCSAYELGLIQEKKKGILVLDEDAIIGSTFM